MKLHHIVSLKSGVLSWWGSDIISLREWAYLPSPSPSGLLQPVSLRSLFRGAASRISLKGHTMSRWRFVGARALQCLTFNCLRVAPSAQFLQIHLECDRSLPYSTNSLCNFCFDCQRWSTPSPSFTFVMTFLIVFTRSSKRQQWSPRKFWRTCRRYSTAEYSRNSWLRKKLKHSTVLVTFGKLLCIVFSTRLSTPSRDFARFIEHVVQSFMNNLT